MVDMTHMISTKLEHETWSEQLDEHEKTVDNAINRLKKDGWKVLAVLQSTAFPLFITTLVLKATPALKRRG